MRKKGQAREEKCWLTREEWERTGSHGDRDQGGEKRGSGGEVCPTNIIERCGLKELGQSGETWREGKGGLMFVCEFTCIDVY